MKIKTKGILLVLAALLFITSLFTSCSSPSSADTPDKNAGTENTNDDTTESDTPTADSTHTVNVTNENIVETIGTLSGNCTIVATGDFSNVSLNSIGQAINARHSEDETFFVSFNLSGVRGLTRIEAFAFDQCTALKSIYLPDGVTSIEDAAFQQCTSLTSINIPDSVTSIGSCAFNMCEGLTNITIPNNVTYIGNCAFQACTGLTSINIPSSVSIIESSAFYHFKGMNIQNVYFEETDNWKIYEMHFDYSINDYDTRIDKTPDDFDLSNPATAAVYLTYSYSWYQWEHSATDN